MSTPRQYQFDVDTKRYLNRVNTYRSLNGLADIQKSDAADIDNFVIGLKDLGVWQKMIFWPLRSFQNVGAGTKVLNLGGLGYYDGTMINGPVWGTNGITFDNALSQYIFLGSSQIIPGNSDYTGISISKLVDIPVVNLPSLTFGNSRGASISVAANGDTRNRAVAWDVSGGFPGTILYGGPTTSFHAHIAAGDSNSAQFYYNKALGVTRSGDYRINPSSPRLESIGAFNNTPNTYGSFWNGDIAFSSFLSLKLTNAQIASFYDLYNITIGKGLNLP